LALGFHAGGGGCVGEAVRDPGAGARLDRERALAGGRDELVEDAVGLVSQAPQPGRREYQRVEFVAGELPQARVDIAADADDVEVLARGPDLRGAAEAAGADTGAGGEFVE